MINATSAKKLLQNKLILVAVIAVVGAAAIVPVYAHYTHDEGFTHRSDFDCVWNQVGISEGDGGGYSKTEMKSLMKGKRYNRDEYCAADFTRPIEHLRVKTMLYKKNGSSWELCVSSPNHYNETSESDLTMATDHGASPPCGEGIYMIRAYGQLKNDDIWYGGWITSDPTGHPLP